MLRDDQLLQLQKKANDIRISIIESLVEAGSGHTAGPLGMADVFAYLYFHALRHDPNNPSWEDRDRLVLSNGHICPVLYATMAHAGYFPIQELQTLRKFGSRLQGHPHREFLSYVETSSGPLGCGLSQAVGMAIVDQIDDRKDRYVYALLSDGELQEGNTWEAVMLAAKRGLGNLITIIDRNYIQIDGNTEDIMPLDPLMDKWESFNWHAQEIDGHSFSELDEAIGVAKSAYTQPSVIIARTIPGKGVPEFERDYRWHGKPPNSEEASRAIETLQKII